MSRALALGLDWHIKNCASLKADVKALARVMPRFRAMSPAEQRRYEQLPGHAAAVLGVFRRPLSCQGRTRARGAGRPATRRRVARSSSTPRDGPSDLPRPRRALVAGGCQ